MVGTTDDHVGTIGLGAIPHLADLQIFFTGKVARVKSTNFPFRIMPGHADTRVNKSALQTPVVGILKIR